MQERDTHFIGFARLLIDELISFQHTDDRPRSETVIARRAYDLVNHTLWHSTPAAGSAIKKYQGMTIEEITQHIPDLTEWPVEPGK